MLLSKDFAFSGHTLFLKLIAITNISKLFPVHSWRTKLLARFEPPSTNSSEMIFGIAEVVTIQKAFFREDDTKWDYPSLSNLQLYLNLLSHNQNCFISIDNFQNANLVRPTSPVVVRYPIPFVNKLKSGIGTFYEITLGLDISVSRNLRTKNSIGNLCPMSGFLKSSPNLKNICLWINLRKYLSHSKPFTCTIHLGIFPPAYVLNSWIHHPIIFENVLTHMLPRHMATVSSISPLHGIITPKQETSPLHDLSIRIRWIKSVSVSIPYPYHHVVFLILHAEASKSQNSKKLSDKRWNIESAEILKICQTCLQDGSEIRGSIVAKEIKIFGQKFLRKLAYGFPSETFVWSVRSNTLMENMLALSLTFIRTFENHEPDTWTHILSQATLTGKVAVAHSHVWKTIMGNFSFSKEYEVVNFFQIFLGEAEYDRSIFIFPYNTKDYLSTLRLIGCGTQGLSSFLFQELVTIFDKYIWLLIVSTILKSSLAANILYKNLHLSGMLLSLLKVFLEEGNPFSFKIINAKHIRSMLGTLMFTGVILSNAYKNTNVYNMVVPRKPVAYQYLDELIRDNFSFYARSFDICFGNIRACNNIGFEKIDGSMNDYGSLFIETEVTKFLERYNSSNKIFNSLKLKLHPQVTSLIRKKLLERKEIPTKPVISINDYDKIHDVFLNIKKEEEMIFLKLLEKCEKMAFAVPFQRSLEYQKTIARRKKFTGDLFIGTESLSEIDWMFYLAGSVPPHLIERIHKLEESGIWQWWVELLTSRIMENIKADHVEAATMKGNTVVIFVVWITGVGFALICRILELVCGKCFQKIGKKTSECDSSIGYAN